MKRSTKVLLLALAGIVAACGKSSAPPAIISFTASPTAITAGQSTTLSWEITGASELSIDNGVGPVTGSSKTVTPTQTTTYTITATNLGGSSLAQVTVTVGAAVPKPVIASFTANRTSVAPGGTVRLNWTITGTLDTATIDNSVGNVKADTNAQGVGFKDVTVPANAPVGTPITYVLTAGNAGGTTTANASVGVHAASLRVDYTDPPAGGKVRLVKDTALSTNSTLVLNVVVGSAAVTGFGVALNLPWDNVKARLNTNALTFNSTVLDPGASPATAAAVAPDTGALAGMMTVGVARKKQFKTDGDVSFAAGAKLFSLKIDVNSATTTGTIFDATTLNNEKRFNARLVNKAGTDVVGKAEFAIGTLYTSL